MNLVKSFPYTANAKLAKFYTKYVNNICTQVND